MTIAIKSRSESIYLAKKGQFPYYPSRNGERSLEIHCVLSTPTGRVSKRVLTYVFCNGVEALKDPATLAPILNRWMRTEVATELRKAKGYGILELVQSIGEEAVGLEVELPPHEGSYRITPWIFNPVIGQAYPAEGLAFKLAGPKAEAVRRAEQVLRARSVEGGDLHGKGLTAFDIESCAPNYPFYEATTVTLGAAQ